MLRALRILIPLLLTSQVSLAVRLCEKFDFIECHDTYGPAYASESKAVYPSTSSVFNINPSGITIQEGIGLEVMNFGQWWEFGIAGGTGAVGSGVSLGTTEGIFFGARQIEGQAEYQDRQRRDRKYQSQTLSSALAVRILGNEKSFARLNLGLIGKYNLDTNKIGAGLGATVSTDNMSLGVARVRQTAISPTTGNPIYYYSDAINFGVNLFNLNLSYTYLRSLADEWSRVRIITAALFIKSAIFTYGNRQEESIYDEFQEDTNTFSQSRHYYTFLGLQFRIKKHALVGVFYNYYLLDELSGGVSLFF